MIVSRVATRAFTTFIGLYLLSMLILGLLRVPEQEPGESEPVPAAPGTATAPQME